MEDETTNRTLARDMTNMAGRLAEIKARINRLEKRLEESV